MFSVHWGRSRLYPVVV